MIPPKRTTGIRRIINAIGYSIEGLKSAFKTEAAFRQELAIFAVFAPIAFALDVTTVERVLLISSLFLILIVEIINTAFESTIERISTEWHHLSKITKDLGSAAVLLSLINAGVIWIIILIG